MGVNQDSTEDQGYRDSEDHQSRRSQFAINTLKEIDKVDGVQDRSGERTDIRDEDITEQDQEQSTGVIDATREAGEVDQIPDRSDEAIEDFTKIVEDNDQEQPDRVKNKSTAIATEDVPTREPSSEEAVYSHESGDLFAEDVDQHMAVLPEIVMSTVEVSIDDIQVGDPGIPLAEDQEKLRQ